jgi:DNA processing protein
MQGAGDVREIATRDLLGELNPYEQKFAPDTLYYIGNPDLVRSARKVSVIGSRNASPEGLRRATKLATKLVEGGITIVSGMAEGIDSAAHWAAIRAGGNTFAVLGTPLDQPYPLSNKALYDELARSHLIVSQFPIGYRSHRGTFPMRNRTMALLTDATVIIEAGEQSGTMHQAWEAIRLDRPLFLLKSVAEDAALTWPAKVIEYGAQVLSDDSLQPLIDNLPMATAFDKVAAAF